MRASLFYLSAVCAVPLFAQQGAVLPRHEVLGRRMTFTIVAAATADTGSVTRPIATVAEALSHLGSAQGRAVDITALHAFLDSAATELWRIGSPTILFWCDEVSAWANFDVAERTCACRWACHDLPASDRGAFERARHGLDVFNRRTRLLLGI